MRQAPVIAGAATAPGSARRRTIGYALIALVALVALRLIFGHHENAYEKIASGVTIALQKNDVAGVKQYQNAETATHVTASRVGLGADALAPLGSLKTVKETSADAGTRMHQFDLTFDKGTLHESIKFDPDNKIVGFHYDQPVLTK